MLPRFTPAPAQRPARLPVLLLISLLALPGCALPDLRPNVKDLAPHGIVQAASQLLPSAQTKAGRMFGFEYGPVEALQEKDMLAKPGQFLAE